MIIVAAFIVVVLAARIILYGREFRCVIPRGRHRPRAAWRVLGAFYGVTGFTLRLNVRLEFKILTPLTGTHSGKAWGIARGIGFPLRRVRKYGKGELLKIFHEESDSFAFGVDSGQIGISTYSYVRASRPYINGAGCKSRRLITAMPPATFILKLCRIRKQSVYASSVKNSSIGGAIDVCHHGDNFAWRFGWLRGPFYGGKEVAPCDVAMSFKRLK